MTLLARFCRKPFAPIGLVLLTLATDCAPAPKPILATVAPGCAAALAAFAGAARALAGPVDATPKAYWAALRRAAPGDRAASRRVTADTGALADAIDQATQGYGTLEACRLDRAAAIRAASADGRLGRQEAGRQLAAIQAGFDQDLAMARRGMAAVEARQAVLATAAERLIAQSPGSRLEVAKAVAAPPLPARPFVVLRAAIIYARPDAGSGQIALLRMGQRVQGPGGGPAIGWTTIELNDGSLGYVGSAALRPVQPNPSALLEAARARQARQAGGDPIVALALAIRQALPQRSEAFAALVEDSVEGATLASGQAASPAGTTGAPPLLR